jgi:hypothetical protein
MPKSLFYAGVVSCALLALSSAALVGYTIQPTFTARTHYLLLGIVLISVPVASILLRMASLIAARSLFAAIFAAFSVACAGVAVIFLASVQLRIVLLLRHLAFFNPEAAERSLTARSLLEVQQAGFYVLGWFVAIALLSLRPYFRIQASRTLSALVWLPAPLFIWSLFTDVAAGGVPDMTSASMIYWTILAILFFMIAVHSIRHRHLFIEVTNLRELLDTRAVHAHAARRPMPPIKDVAFDS